jgi:hypothetical protein
LPQLSESSLRGVGQDESPVASMRGANIGRSNSSPFRIEPERGKFSEYGSSCWKSENWRDVFNKNPSGLNFANDSHVLEEESTGVSIKPSLSSGNGQVGAWETANDSVHATIKRSAVEGSYIRPDSSVWNTPVFSTRRQDSGRREFPLHAHERASSSNSDIDGDVKYSCAGK